MSNKTGLATEFRQMLIDAMVDRTLSTCSRWASKRRIMGGDFPGPYSWKYHPWVKEMMDSKASFNYSMKAAQLGITECGINRAFYVLDRLKRDVLYVLPTSINASDFSKARFSGALKLSPYLANLFTDTNTVNLKQAGACNLYIRGSRGDSNLKSIPVSELILDEVDEMDQKQIWLALTRLDGQLRKCVWGISTPTIPNYGIHKLYQKTTQEHFRFVCPHCSRHTELIWPDCVEVIGESINDPRCHESYLKCKECGHKLEHAQKPEYLSEGEWHPSVDADPDVRGFYINQLYSFTVTPGEIVVANFRGLGDEAAAKEFHNSKMGLPYIGEGAQVSDQEIDAAIGNYSINQCYPKRGRSNRLITLGVDQGKWCHWTACEWFLDGGFTSDINASAMCKVLGMGKFHELDWNILDELMVQWQVMACVVDADPQINEARRFAKKYHGYAYLCRYRSGKVGKEIVESNEDAPMLTVDRTNWLTASLGRFRLGKITLPADVSIEFRDHMKALVRTYVRDENNNPIATFVDTEADHYAHALNYAEIALPMAASIVSGQSVEKLI